MSLAMPLMDRSARAYPIIRVRFEPEFQDPALIEALHQGRFSAHSEAHHIGSPVNWIDNPSDDIEWHILLHKFFHAPVLVQAWLDSGETRHITLLEAHIRSWVAQVSPGHIAADVTGRRIRNWVYALSLLDGAFPALDALIRQSIGVQVIWLTDNLHPARNHRTLELFAIYIAGVFLQDSNWTDFAMAELLANARSDFLPDGAHVELSSHYHCIALRNFIEAVQLADDNDLAVPAKLREIIARASHFAHMLHKPDGMIPALSDADVGDYRAMLSTGRTPQLIEVFPDAGYVIMRDKAAVAGNPMGHYLVLDCGAIGAGNHGHLDCLSFEFAALGRSLIVDPGRYSYNEKSDPNWRAAFRKTRAHNVVQVDGREQTCYRQGPKRMKVDGPSPAVEIVEIKDHGDWRHVHVRCQSAEYPVLHDRHVIAHDKGWWVIFDRMTAPDDHRYDALFQLEPAAFDHAHIIETACGVRNILAPNMLIMPRAGAPLTLSFEQGWVSPIYGEKHRAPRLVCGQRGQSAWFATMLLPFKGALPDLPFQSDAAGFTVAGQRYAIGQTQPAHGFTKLDHALDPKAAATAIGKDLQAAGFACSALSVEIERVRLKPDRKALIGYRLTGSDAVGAPFDQRMMLTLWVGGLPAQLPVLNGADSAQPQFGPPTLDMPTLQGSAWFFPNDRKIAHITDLLAEGARVGAVEVIHYVPEQGCTIRVTGDDMALYGKARADDRGAVASSIGAPQSSAIRLAPIVSYDSEKRILWQQALEGAPISLTALTTQPELWAPRFAEAISAFHGLTPPMGLKSLTVQSIAKTIGARVERTAAIMPDLEVRLGELAHRLNVLRPAETPLTLSHCDLHPNNLLWDGTSFALIDLDTAALAPDAFDYGTLVASIAHRALDSGTSVARVSAKIEAFRQAEAPVGFDWFVAASLLGERLYRCGTRLKSHRFGTRAALVDLASACFDRMEKAHA